MPSIYLKRILITAMLSSSIATMAFAEDGVAPVFDADSMPPQFDGQPDSIQPASQQAQPEPYLSTPSLTLDQRIGRVEQQVKNLQRTDSAAKMTELQNDVRTLRGQVEELTHQLQQIQTQQRTMYSDLDKRLSTVQTQAQAAAKNKVQKAAPPAPAVEDTIEPQPAVAAVSAKSSKVTKLTKPVKAPTPDVDTDTIATNTAAPAETPKVAAAPPVENQPNVAEEQQIYQTAYNLIKARKYNDAITALQKMLKKYPSGQFAANAHYWLGELYGLTGKNDQSAAEFSTVVRNFPDSPKVSDAQLKLGLIYAAQLKWPEAKMAFKKVINNYPGTASARLAAEQIKQIKQAGH